MKGIENGLGQDIGHGERVWNIEVFRPRKEALFWQVDGDLIACIVDISVQCSMLNGSYQIGSIIVGLTGRRDMMI